MRLDYIFKVENNRTDFRIFRTVFRFSSYFCFFIEKWDRKRNVLESFALSCIRIPIVLFVKSFLNDRRLHVGHHMISDIHWTPVSPGPFLPLSGNKADVLTKPRFNARRLTYNYIIYVYCTYFWHKSIDTPRPFSLRSNRYRKPTRGTSEKPTSQPERKRYGVYEKCYRNRIDNNYNRC